MFDNYLNAILPAMLAFVVSGIVCKLMLPMLYKLKFGQYIREDGPQAHLKKQGTPTMGGIGFVISTILVSLVFMLKDPSTVSKVLPVLLVMVGFGLVGFLDDYIKVALKHNEGLKPKQKLAAQLLIAALFCWYLMSRDVPGIAMKIPFLTMELNLGWLFIPAYLIIVLGTDNGVNLTDGLDGLNSTVTMVVAIFFTVVSLRMGAGIEAVTAAVAGSLAGFLLYNSYPAKVFMGDTGSLALGGFVVSSAFMTNTPIFIVLCGIIYLVETVSVILQVGYFKKTGGKRLFKMAPIHHHFEACGWSETRIVTVFGLVTAMGCLLALVGLR